MRLENSFDVPADPDAAWELLMDVPRVVPCMPGAELVETVSESAWKARVKARLGPISLLLDTDVTRESADPADRVVVLVACARDQRGRGQADARIRSALVVEDGHTRVDIETDLTLSGSIARFGRASVVEDVASQLIGDFAAALRAELEAGDGGPPPEPPQHGAAVSPGADPAPAARRPPPPAKPVSALRILVRMLRQRLRRLVART